MACTGVAQPVIDRQSDTGVKDAYTQFWINQLIERAREMKNKEPGRAAESIMQELHHWVVDNKSKISYHILVRHSRVPFLI